MSYYIDPILRQQTDRPFPLPGPGGYEFIRAYFAPDWPRAEGPTRWAEMHWMTPEWMGIDFSRFTAMIAQAFADLGENDHAIAWRLYHKEYFDVQIPERVCTPDWLPWIGQECIDTPLGLGGTNLITAHGWALQVLYQGNSPAAVAPIALTGSLTLILLVIGIFAVIFLASSGEISLSPQLIKIIEQATPGGAAGEITKVFLVAAIAFGVIAFVLPNIAPTTATTIKAGPVTTQLGLGRPAAAPRQPARR